MFPSYVSKLTIFIKVAKNGTDVSQVGTGGQGRTRTIIFSDYKFCKSSLVKIPKQFFLSVSRNNDRFGKFLLMTHSSNLTQRDSL